MDVLESFMVAGEMREAFRVSRRTSAQLVQWSEASSNQRPAIVFIPGFLSEKPSEFGFGKWTEQIMSFAKKRNWAAYGLYWPSMETSDILNSVNWMNLFEGFAQVGRRKPWYSMLGTSVIELLNIQKVCRQALRNADKIGGNPDRWLSSLKRPVILIGHSLGGRIALQTAMNHNHPRLLQVSAFAPAILASDCDFRQIKKGQKKKGAIFHSENDTTLRYLYRAGELSTVAPLGLEGVPEKERKLVRSIDVSEYKGMKIRHNSYASVCMQLVKKLI